MSKDFPRVTEILKPFCNYDKVPKMILENAASRGTRTHGICSAIAQDCWIPEFLIDEDIKGYVKSFRLWKDRYVKQFYMTEERFRDETLGFTGQLDLVIIDKNDKKCLVDLKTSSSPQKTYPIQLAAYNHLLSIHNEKVESYMLVYLDKSGLFPNIHIFQDIQEEFDVFLSALKCYNHFNKKVKNGEVIKSASEDQQDNG